MAGYTNFGICVVESTDTVLSVIDYQLINFSDKSVYAVANGGKIKKGET
jgi:hypothetical protein